MEKVYKIGFWVLLAFAFFVLLSAYSAKPAGATYQPSFHTEWKNEGHVKWGVCEAKAACGTTEGVQKGTQKQGCKLVQGQGSFECQLGHQRYVSVERSCEVETPTCEEPKDYCDTLEGTQDEETYCPPVEEEEPPVVEQPKKDTPDAPKVRFSQGPHGVKGDGKCQIEWGTIKGSKKVEIRYAEDGIFGNGYKTLTTKDDGAEYLNADSGKMKLRGRDSKTEWSKAKSFSC